MDNKYQHFIELFDWLVTNCKYPVELTEDIKEVKEQLIMQSQNQKEKPLVTETGLKILEFLQSSDVNKMKASEIAEGMEVSTRKISGAIRKLVTDKFVEKKNLSSPIMYGLTDKGRNFNIEKYKENIKED